MGKQVEVQTAMHQDIRGIQYVRAIAALFVVLSHSTGVLQQSDYFNRELFGNHFSSGAVGVDIFFIVSGFIITLVTLKSETLRPKVTLCVYFSKRFTRIVPFLWLCIFLYAALRWLGSGSIDIQSYINAFLLWPIGEVSPNVVWTLRHEALFYTIFAFSFLVSKPKPYFLIIWCISPLILWIVGAGNRGIWSDWAHFLFNKANVEFGFGVLIGLLYQKWPRIRSAYRAPGWVTGGLLISVSILTFCAKLYSFGFIPIVLFALMVVVTGVYMPASNGLLARTFRILGDASYAIYLTHNLVYQIGGTIWIKLLGKNASAPMAVFILFILAVVNGVIVHYIIEKPLIQLLRRWKLPFKVRKQPTEKAF